MPIRKQEGLQTASSALALASKPKKRVSVTLTLPQPHPRQYELINADKTHNARFIVGACGTKFGA